MRNSDFILQNMMQNSIDVLKPRASVARLVTSSDLGYRTIEAAVLVKHAQRLDKVQKYNIILDGDTLVPDKLKTPKRVSSVSQAAKTLVKARVAKKKAA